MDDQQGPTAQHRELCQCCVAARLGGTWGGKCIHVYVWLSPFVSHVWQVDVLLGIHERYLLTALMVLNEIENSHALKKKKIKQR